MKFDTVLMNAPYQGNLHLKIQNNMIGSLSEDGVCCAIHPARWFTDPLAELKSTTDWQRFPDLVNGMVYAKLYDIESANKFFGIENCTDIIISVIKKHNPAGTYSIYNNPLYKSCFNKIISFCQKQHSNIFEHCERNAILGWRIEIKDILFPVFNQDKAKKAFVYVGPEAFKNGYRTGVDKDNNDPGKGYWTETVGKSQIKRNYPDPIPLSIGFNSEEECLNFRDTNNTKFMINWCYMIKTDMHTPLGFQPFLPEYEHVWTDDELCEFFNLTDEEKAYMLRDIDNYVVKDFIKYEIV